VTSYSDVFPFLRIVNISCSNYEYVILSSKQFDRSFTSSREYNSLILYATNENISTSKYQFLCENNIFLKNLS